MHAFSIRTYYEYLFKILSIVNLFSPPEIGHSYSVAYSITAKRCSKYDYDGSHFADDIWSTFSRITIANFVIKISL